MIMKFFLASFITVMFLSTSLIAQEFNPTPRYYVGGGIRVSAELEEAGVNILAVTSSAREAGLGFLDYITVVNGTSVHDLGLEGLRALFRESEPGTELVIGATHKGESKTVTIVIQKIDRAEWTVVESQYAEPNKTGGQSFPFASQNWLEFWGKTWEDPATEKFHYECGIKNVSDRPLIIEPLNQVIASTSNFPAGPSSWMTTDYLIEIVPGNEIVLKYITTWEESGMPINEAGIGLVALVHYKDDDGFLISIATYLPCDIPEREISPALLRHEWGIEF